MSDELRNEKARCKHRQIVKDFCSCISLPSNVVLPEDNSVINHEFKEENHYGWEVFEKSPADRDYQLLQHIESTDNFKGYPSSKRATFGSRRNSHRNEDARQRHRVSMKDEHCCTSVTGSLVATSESSSSSIPRFSEENNFGWAIFRKSYGDPDFEKLMEFEEKPDITGNVFNKKTRVLYLKEGAMVKRNAYTSTDSSNSLPIGNVETQPPKPQSSKRERGLIDREPENKEKRKSLIDEYYFPPIKETPSSQSPKTGKAKQKALSQVTDLQTVPSTEKNKLTNKQIKANEEAGYISDSSSQENLSAENKKGKKKNKTKKKRSADQYLRAGGDLRKVNISGTDKSFFLQKISEFIVKLKPSDVAMITRYPEYLLKTPSGTNKYLYLSRMKTRK